MPLYTFDHSSLNEVPKGTFEKQGVLERKHLQVAIRDHPAVLGEDLLILAEEFAQWEDTDRRIDLLAVDRSGSLVVIELKRDEKAGHAELQAIRYAAMVAPMTFQDAISARVEFLKSRGKEIGVNNVELELRAFIRPEEQTTDEDPAEATLSGNIRIILAAADFSKEVSATVLWLRDYEIDIRCVRLVPYLLEGQILIHAETVLPLPEVRDYLVRISRRNEAAREAEGAARAKRVLYNLCMNGETDPQGPHNRRRLFAKVIHLMIKSGVHPDQLMTLTRNPKLFQILEGSPASEEIVRILKEKFPDDAKVEGRFDHAEDQLIRLEGKTYILFNQNSQGQLPLLKDMATDLGFVWSEHQVPQQGV